MGRCFEGILEAFSSGNVLGSGGGVLGWEGLSWGGLSKRYFKSQHFVHTSNGLIVKKVWIAPFGEGCLVAKKLLDLKSICKIPRNRYCANESRDVFLQRNFADVEKKNILQTKYFIYEGN